MRSYAFYGSRWLIAGYFCLMRFQTRSCLVILFPVPLLFVSSERLITLDVPFGLRRGYDELALCQVFIPSQLSCLRACCHRSSLPVRTVDQVKGSRVCRGSMGCLFNPLPRFNI